MNFEGIGFPELHTLPDLLATRTRVALAEGVCWRGGHGRHASTHPPPWEQGFALRGQREQRVHQKALPEFEGSVSQIQEVSKDSGKNGHKLALARFRYWWRRRRRLPHPTPQARSIGPYARGIASLASSGHFTTNITFGEYRLLD